MSRTPRDSQFLTMLHQSCAVALTFSAWAEDVAPSARMALSTLSLRTMLASLVDGQNVSAHPLLTHCVPLTPAVARTRVSTTRLPRRCRCPRHPLWSPRPLPAARCRDRLELPRVVLWSLPRLSFSQSSGSMTHSSEIVN